ncbi:cytochrome P450 [Rivularia sp. IAM M-261]|nr:cytochrome P450 [Calothrix sp. PCC 7716]GJD17680.1 cytochrome P450 [Rivularia sp. IAM M-261]
MVNSKQTLFNNLNQIQDVFTLPRPKGNFILGNIIEFGKDALGFMTQCAQQYGDIVPLHLGNSPTILVTNPNYIEQILKDRELFGKAKALKNLNALLGQGLLVSEGETWFRQRRLAQPMFHQKRIGSYGEVMVDYTNKMLLTWQDGETRDINADMMRLTFNIVMKTLFSSDVTEDQAHAVAQAMSVAAEWFLARRKSPVSLPEQFPTPSNLRYKYAVGEMDKHIYKIINQRRASGEDTGDLLSMMMQARDEDDGSQMSDKQLRDEIATLIFAGHETSANTLAWTWMLLSQHPEVQAKLQQEYKDVLGDRSPTVADLSALPYTNMVIKESMRLFPVVWNMVSETTRDCEIGNYHVPAGCTIIMSQWVMHRSNRYFKQPEVFNPERWAGDLEKQLPRGVYTPFGDGPRICIGKSFALMESVLLLATIAQKFEITLIPGQTITPEATITLQPNKSIKVIVKQRVN